LSPLNDPDDVRTEYADESRFAVRAGVWDRATGPNPVTMCREAVAEVAPRRVLEVGPGRGETAEWIARETGAVVVAVDQSERMVELTRARGIDAILGDAQELPFEDGAFDCVVAAWMLYHVADIDRALAEIARVLVPGGRLVAVTNSSRHYAELKELMGVSTAIPFRAEEAGETLSRHFSAVERRNACGEVIWEPEEAIAYVRASPQVFPGDRLPELDAPIRVTKAPVIFVATK
jgi:ubiquinone/menaquinone biosynthesis C-methylase UbiE